MVPGEDAPEPQADLREHDRDVLAYLSQDPDSQVAFQGLKRRLGLHPEQLTRALHRLEEDGYVVNTEEGYRVTAKGLSLFGPTALATVPVGTPILLTYLPTTANPAALTAALRGTWVGPLRWYGQSSTEEETTLTWTTEDDGIQLDLRLREGALVMMAHVDAPARMDEAARLGYLLFESVSRAMTRESFAAIG